MGSTVSGDLPVVMLGTTGGVPAGRMLTALDTVQRRLPRPAALVGGIAVAARLGTMERATADIDAVVDAPDDPPSVQLLLDAGAAAPHPSPNSVVVDGIKVDLIDTYAVPNDAFQGAHGLDSLFAAAHRYAFDTATPLRLAVPDGPEVVARVATPSALVAMKLHAACSRKDLEMKVPGDLFDLYRLLDRFERQGSVSSDLAATPGLGDLCHAAATRTFVDRLAANAGIMARSADAVIASIRRADLADVGDLFLDRLARALLATAQ